MRIPRAFALGLELECAETRDDDVALRKVPVKFGHLLKDFPYLPQDFPDDIEKLEVEQRESL